MRGLCVPSPSCCRTPVSIFCRGDRRYNFEMRRVGALSRYPQSAVGPHDVDGGGGGSGGGDGGAAAGAAAAAAAVPSGTDAAAARAAGQQQQQRRAASARGGGKFRFWHDERRFKGSGDRCVVQQALFEAGGVRTGGYPKCSPLPGPLGHQRGGDWDFLWSPARTALMAVPGLKPGQLVSALPGMTSLTKKRRLSVTLKRAYGDDAFRLVPLTFSLPTETAAWRRWLEAEAAAGRDPGPWMLKTAQHLGLGLCLLPGDQAFARALQPRAPAAKPFVLAQRYVANPLLIGGRKFGVRLWVLVTGHAPYRAYLSDRGLVLFSTEGYDAETLSDDAPSGSDDDGEEPAAGAAGQQQQQQATAKQQAQQQQQAQPQPGAAGRGHVTNYAQNVDGTVWDLEALKTHLGAAAYDVLWEKLADSAARVAAAALPAVLDEQATLAPPPDSSFELLGLDYLVDDQGTPWLLEVNGTPSLAVEHSDPAVEALIRDQKSGMVRDMVALLGCSTRFDARYQLLRAAVAKDKAAARRFRQQLMTPGGSAQGGGGAEGDALALAKAELRRRGGFAPLAPRFPLREAYEKGYALPWGALDYELADWMAAHPEEWRDGGASDAGAASGGVGGVGGGGGVNAAAKAAVAAAYGGSGGGTAAAAAAAAAAQRRGGAVEV